MEIDENSYNTNLPIKYVFQEGKSNKKMLIIVFSGFASPKASIQISYNYLRILNNIDCNKLFILDNYGPKGCYYLGERMSFEVETSVISLITHIIRKCNIRFEDVVSAGSSKGASAALYYGLKYNFGHIIIGAPQILIGEYISYVSEETANYIMGPEKAAKDRNKLNELIIKQIEKPILSKISVLSSKNDWQYESHLIPFILECNKRQISVDLKLDDRMADHGEIGGYYSEFLLMNLLYLLYNIQITYINMSAADSIISFSSDVKEISDHEIKILNKVMENGVVIYQSEGQAPVEMKEPGNYDVCSDLLVDGVTILTVNHGKMIFGGDQFDYLGYNIQIDGKNLTFSIDIKEKQPIQFAYYIFKDGLIVEKIWYSTNKSIRYPIKESGEYQVGFFYLDERWEENYVPFIGKNISVIEGVYRHFGALVKLMYASITSFESPNIMTFPLSIHRT